MPLTNFGAVLNFAETLEKDDMLFYGRAADAADDASMRTLFGELSREGQKHVSLVQRTRRENVTEMILEPIQGLSRNSYQMAVDDAAGLDSQARLTAAMALETRAVRYYNDAAEKIRALPEVSRALKTLAKKRVRRLERVRGAAG